MIQTKSSTDGRFNFRALFFLFFLGTALVFMQACQTDEASTSSDSGSDTDGETVCEEGDEGCEDDGSLDLGITGFGISAVAQDAAYSLLMTQNGDGITACEVNGAETEINCVIDLEELDLWFHGVEFTMSVSNDTCDYVGFVPYYYNVAPMPSTVLSSQSAQVPSAVEYQTLDGEIEVPSEGVSSGASNDIYYYFPTKSDGSAGGWVAHEDLYGEKALDTSDLRCPWDYSNEAFVENAKNCCWGKYNLNAIVRTTGPDDDADGNPDSYSIDDSGSGLKQWTGSPDACFDGPGKRDWTARTPYNMIDGTLYKVPLGGREESFVVTAPNEVPNKPIRHAANHYVASTMPQPLADGQRTFRYRCYDHNRELQSVINVSVREWNEAGELDSDGDGVLDASGNPNTSGTEDSPFSSFAINDFFDWDDYSGNYGLSYFGFDMSSGASSPILDYISTDKDETTTYHGFLPD